MRKKKQVELTRRNLPPKCEGGSRFSGNSELDPFEMTRIRDYRKWKEEGELRGRVH